jgi:DNA polymerase III subunit delta'
MTGPDLLGHAQIRALLARATARDTLPHTLLFAGPDGVGKRTCALALAAAVNCTDQQQGEACGHCPSCRRVARLAHPDVVLIEPNEKGTITVEMARDVIERASYRPFEGRRRVVVIDAADQMQPAAQNALLKTLEEPPPSSMFVLVTARPDMLLITVRSRCHRLRFGPLSVVDVAAILRARRGMDEAAAAALAAVADGSVSRALAEDTGDLDDARQVALVALEGLAAGSTPSARLGCAQTLADGGKKGDGARKKGAGTEREALARRLDALASLLRDLAGIAHATESRVLGNPDLERRLGALARHFDLGRTVHGFRAVEQARRALERNQSPKVVADWVAGEM